jgi:hypothetical protein
VAGNTYTRHEKWRWIVKSIRIVGKAVDCDEVGQTDCRRSGSWPVKCFIIGRRKLQECIKVLSQGIESRISSYDTYSVHYTCLF